MAEKYLTWKNIIIVAALVVVSYVVYINLLV
jgi:hypothetical protein